MFIWEVLIHRLRMEGWRVWQTTCRGANETTYLVHLARGGEDCLGKGPTLTEALADAVRKRRESQPQTDRQQWSMPHFESTQTAGAGVAAL